MACADYDLVEALASEFVSRLRSGEYPTIDEYAAKHPVLANDIRDLFPAVATLEKLKIQESRSIDGRASLAGSQIERFGDLRITREIGRGGMISGLGHRATRRHEGWTRGHGSAADRPAGITGNRATGGGASHRRACVTTRRRACDRMRWHSGRRIRRHYWKTWLLSTTVWQNKAAMKAAFGAKRHRQTAASATSAKAWRSRQIRPARWPRRASPLTAR